VKDSVFKDLPIIIIIIIGTAVYVTTEPGPKTQQGSTTGETVPVLFVFN
jgi:hypothetical protein